VTLADLERHPAPATLRLDTGDLPARGAPGAAVTIVQLGDYHSPETRRIEPTVRGLVEGDDAPARLLWKDTDRGDGPDYHLPARAARAAGEQEDFWSMHDHLLRGPAEPGLDKVRKLARELELDEHGFMASLQSPGSTGAAELDALRAGKLPVLCTPTFIVNGRIVEGGSIAGAALQAAVDDEVAAQQAKAAPRAPRAIAPGGPITGAAFDAHKMARVVADVTGKRAAKR
jgi:protein-disulfide isomerase